MHYERFKSSRHGTRKHWEISACTTSNEKNSFQEYYHPTIGAAHVSLYTINKTTGDKTNLQIWETSGQERYKSLMPMYYRGAHIILLTFCDRASFEELKKSYIPELQNQGPENSSIIIVRTKSDTEEAQEVSNDEVAALQQQKGIPLCQFNTSAKENHNCATLCEHILALPAVVHIVSSVTPPSTRYRQLLHYCA